MPSITQLEYIIAVDTHKHFGEAAKACFVSQPSLSMQIQKVEEELGIVIFDRLKKPIVATEKGAQFIQQAKLILREHQKLLALSKQVKDEVSGHFKLAIIPTLASYLLPLFIESFSKLYPLVELTVYEMKTEDIIDALKHDRIDGGILVTPLHEEQLYEKVLFYEPFQVYLSKKHPLAKHHIIDETKISSDDLWLLQDGHCFKNQVMKVCSLKKEKDVYQNIHFAGGGLETLRNMIKKGQGLTLVPYLFTFHLSSDERRDHCRELSKPVPFREVSLVVRRDQWKEDIIKALANSIVNSLPNELKEVKSPKKGQIVPIY